MRIEAEKRKREAQEQKERERRERDRRIAELLKANKEEQKAGRTSWKKLGGLGADIGSEKWYERYNKYAKMQVLICRSRSSRSVSRRSTTSNSSKHPPTTLLPRGGRNP